MSETNSMRRVPTRKRGQERVAKILDAASVLFAEAGYESITTNQIAAHAQTSIGSLYQFFPNKEAIMEELANRYNDDLRVLLDQRLHQGDLHDFPAMLDRLIDTLHEFYINTPGTRPVFHGAYKSESIEAASQELVGEILTRFDGLLANYMPHMDAHSRQIKGGLIASVIKSQVSAMEMLAPSERAGASEMGDMVITSQQWRDELKLMIRAYLETF